MPAEIPYSLRTCEISVVCYFVKTIQYSTKNNTLVNIHVMRFYRCTFDKERVADVASLNKPKNMTILSSM